MSFQNGTIAQGGTLSVTGGTAKTLKSLGSSVGSNSLYIDEDTDATTRRTVSVTAKAGSASANAPGGFTQDRVSISYKQPKILANLARTVNTVRIEVSVDPETTDAERAALREEAAQFLFDVDFVDLFTKCNAS